MEIIDISSQSLFFRFLFTGILIFVLLRILRYIIPLIFRRQNYRRTVKRYFPFGETLLWVLYLSWYILRFSKSNLLFAMVISVALLGVLFWVSKFALKDLIAGMIFRLTSAYKPGDVLRISGSEGKLLNWTLLGLELETSAGEILKVPYSKLVSESQLKTETNQFATAYNFSFTCKVKDDPALYASRIKHFIIELPWSSIHQQTAVSFASQGDKVFMFKVNCYPLEKNYARKIEEKVLDKFGE